MAEGQEPPSAEGTEAEEGEASPSKVSPEWQSEEASSGVDILYEPLDREFAGELASIALPGDVLYLEPLSEDLENYSHLYAPEDRPPGLGWALHWFSDSYADEFHSAVHRQLDEFESFDFLEQGEKERVYTRVAQAIAQIQAYQAWRKVIWGPVFDWGTVLSFFAALLIAVLAGAFWADVTGGALTWVGVVLGSIVVFAGGLGLTALTDETPQRVSKWQIFLLLGLSVGAILLTQAEIGWWNGAIRAAVLVGLSASGAFLAAYLCVYWLLKLVANLTERKKVQWYPEDEIIQTLCYLLAYLQIVPHPAHTADRREVVDHLEWIGRRIEHELYTASATQDAGTLGWLRRSTQEMAADFNRLARDVILPQDGWRDTLVQSLGRKLVKMADGQWGHLERTPPEVTVAASRPLESLIQRAVSVAAIALPFAALAVVLTLQVPLDESREYILLALPASVWGIKNLVGLVGREWDKDVEGPGGLSETLQHAREARGPHHP